MAKRRSRRERDTSVLSLASLPSLLPEIRVRSALSLLRELEDLRQWHPMGGARPARGVRRSSTRLVAPGQVRSRPSRSPRLVRPSAVAFEDPRRVAICVRRRVRREVMHALRLKGRGSGRKRWNQWSHVSCRR